MESKQEEICYILEANREQIEKKELIVYLIDECHLLWGDVCGYAWGATEESSHLFPSGILSKLA